MYKNKEGLSRERPSFFVSNLFVGGGVSALNQHHQAMSKRSLPKWTNWILPVAVVLILAGRYIYFMPQLDSGENAPAFSATLPDGSRFQLDQLKGRYVLMHFWGSWCGPCRSENPQLVALYQRFGGEHFEIVSVGIEKDPARWERAGKQDGLNWPFQLVEITPSFRFFDSPIANQIGRASCRERV